MNPRVRTLALTGVLLLALAPATPRGETELVLVDGRVLSGTEVRRDGGSYVLRLDGGDEITLPAELVESVRLTGKREPEPQTPPTGLVVAEPQTLAGSPPPDGPSGIRTTGPQTLAGAPVRAPTTAEQRGTLGPAAKFQKDIVKNDWQPTTDWNMDPDSQNNFNPSTWAGDVIDPTWEPESAYDKSDDALKDSRSTFRKSIIDNSWQPQDGFAKGN
ncbi:MAG: hypothetical protein GY716_09980 [bacterium]|nr:hypothetical protein [bacterium]